MVPFATDLKKCKTDGCFLISSRYLRAHCFGVSWTRCCPIACDLLIVTSVNPHPYSVFGLAAPCVAQTSDRRRFAFRAEYLRTLPWSGGYSLECRDAAP